MRNSFLPPLPTSQLLGFGSNEFGMPNSDTFSMLDSKINVHTANRFLSLPKLLNGADIEQGNLGGLPMIANPRTADYDSIGGYGSSGNNILLHSASLLQTMTNNQCISHSSTKLKQEEGVYGKRKRLLDGEECSYNEKIMTMKMKRPRRKPSSSSSTYSPNFASHCSYNPIHHNLTHYNQSQQQQVPLRRSQKIGDRITALQKLVSPYGKTDTASVLQEATLYIKLLQDQIQNQFQMLGSPYASTINIRSLQPKEIGEKQSTMDLRSRGLCLIPVSSILTKDDVKQA